MPEHPPLPGWKDKPLFTPGPLTTSRTVKQAMLRDAGSRDQEFIGVIRDIRRALTSLDGVSRNFEAVLMQGSGTFAIEAVLSSAVPRDGKILVVSNGAYGERMRQMASVLGIAHATVRCPEFQTASPEAVAAALGEDPSITHVAAVHCETTTGIMNPVEAIGAVVRDHGRLYVVDAMSSFGAVPLDLEAASIDFLVSSANKCIEGVPGFAFVLARRSALEQTQGYARSLSMDLYSQWKGLEKDGQFRFTPPTHALLAFHQALRELEWEGGIEGRASRYRDNHETLVTGMRALGFVEYLDPAVQGYIITAFRYPDHPNFSFDRFYALLNEKGFVIYPGKVSNADCFRIGHIGRIFKSDVRDLLGAVAATLAEMGINLTESPVA